VWATPAGDGKGDVPGSLSVADLYDRVAHNLYSINYVWALVAGFLVMFMQAGFMFVETGLCRAKNAAHTSAMNFMIYPLGCLASLGVWLRVWLGNWWNGPVPPDVSVARPRPVGVEQRPRARRGDRRAGHATGVYTYGLLGTKGFFLTGVVNDVGVMVLSSS